MCNFNSPITSSFDIKCHWLNLLVHFYEVSPRPKVGCGSLVTPRSKVERGNLVTRQPKPDGIVRLFNSRRSDKLFGLQFLFERRMFIILT
jgi:hypothetical protein